MQAVVNENKTVKRLSPRKNRQKKTPARGAPVIRIGELPTKERMQHDGGVVRVYEPESPKSTVMIMRHRAVAECWLDRYRNKGSLDIEQYAVGIVFRRAYLSVFCGIAVSESSVARVSAGEFDFEKKLDVLMGSERIYKRCMELLTPQQKLAMINICGHDESAGSTARLRTLRRALDIIIRHRWTGRDLFIRRAIDTAMANH